MTRRATPEHDLQTALVRHLQARLKPNVYWCAIPNGEKRSAITGARLKAAGVRAGAPDLILVIAGKAFALELKAAKGRLSEAQIRTQVEWEDAGGSFFTTYSLDDALHVLELIGAIKADTSTLQGTGEISKLMSRNDQVGK